MDKKTVTFFLASSITDLEYDRLAIGDFINQLNNIYQESGIFIKLYKCESDTMDHSIRIEGSQASLDELIQGSDMCFVIFWHKVGEVTFHELKIALDSNRICNKPKIVVYFKKTTADEDPSEEIKNVMRMIDEELLHYHREYSHIDSLKLGIITQLQVHGFVKADITVKDNAIVCADSSIIPVGRIPLFAENAEYTELWENYTKAVENSQRLQAMYAADEGNYKVYRELSKAAKERDRLKADIDELAGNILDIGNSIVSLTTSGKAISDNIRKAIKCFDSGDYDGVLEALNVADIENNVAELDEMEKNVIGERIAIVEEYRMRILALKAQARWDEVHANYIKAVEQVENRPQMPKKVMYEYALFLFQQTQYEKCISVCLSLDLFFKTDDINGKRRKGDAENLCGLAYYKLGKYQEADNILSRCVQIRRELSQADSSFKFDYADSCIDLAKVYYCLNRHARAEALYRDALIIYDFADETDEKQIKKADINIWLAELYYQTNRHREAEDLLKEALDVCNILIKTHADYEKYVADISARLAHINCAILSHRQKDRYFVEAFKLRYALMQHKTKRDKAQAFASLLKLICEILSREYTNYGDEKDAKKFAACSKKIDAAVFDKEDPPITDFSYYRKKIDTDMIEAWCLQSLKIRQKMAQQNPEANERSVVEAYKNLAELYLQTGDLNRAEQFLKEGARMQRRILSFAGQSSDAELAAIHCLFAELFVQKRELNGAEENYLAAKQIYKQFSFSNELARTCNHFGDAYLKFNKTSEALKSYTDSILLYIELYRKSPGAYIDRVINTLANILACICPEKEAAIMSGLMTSLEFGSAVS